MDYMGGKKFWDDKFSARSDKPLPPDKMIVEDERWFQSGRTVLDLACGDGRNALYLAERGMQLTAVDFSLVGLTRLERFANRAGVRVTTCQADLSDPAAFDQLEKFDLIVCNHYRLSGPAAKVLRDHLHPQGVLWINGFVSCPPDNPAIRPEDLIQAEDYLQVGYNLVEQKGYMENQHFYVRLILQGKE